MPFPTGWILPALLALALASGAALLLRPAAVRSQQTLWTFSPPHARELTAVARQTGGPAVDIVTLPARALDMQLQSLRASAEPAPALVEIEIGSIGKHFRGTAPDVPFLPLTDRLQRAGWLDRLSPARLATWTKDGELFAVPLDVHPVALVYRKDLFDAAGIDLTAVTTWAELHERGKAFELFECRNGRPTRAMQLPRGSSDVLVMMLQQRGIDPVDANHRVQFADPRVTETLITCARLVAGATRIAIDPTPGPGRWADDLARGDVAMALLPDWAIEDLRRVQPHLAGRLALRPLPRFDPTDAATASWGGTAVAIPRNTADPEAAWRLLQQLYLSNAARHARRERSPILPAVVDWWADPNEPLPNDQLFHSNPQIVYSQLARQLPRRVVTPFTAMGSSALSLVLYRATAAIDRGNDATLPADVQQWLDDAAADLQSRIAFANLGM